MTMREMKDSGIEWAPRIPESWESKKAKYNFESTKYIPGIESDKYDRLALTLQGVIHRSKEDADGLQPKDFLTYQLLRKGELVFKLIDLQNVTTSRVGLAYDTGLVSPAYIILKSKGEVLPQFAEKYFLMLWHREIFNALGDNGVRSNLSTTDLLNIPICYPCISEQQDIVDFLNTKCSEIDALCADIKSEIDTLEAYKRSVVTECVTKGLDKNVPMKNSGLEWVGEIPETWDIHPVYYYFAERKNRNFALQERNLLSLSYGKIIRKDIDTLGGLLPASFNTYNIVEKGDIIIRPTDLQNDKRSLRTGLVNEKGIITSAYIDLAPKGDVNSEYFHYLLHSYDLQKVFYNMGNGVRQGLNYSEFAKLMVFAPPRCEQNAIVEYLNEQCGLLDSIIAQKQEELAVLADYKKSIIYEYVTGKKEVPTA